MDSLEAIQEDIKKVCDQWDAPTAREIGHLLHRLVMVLTAETASLEDMSVDEP